MCHCLAVKTPHKNSARSKQNPIELMKNPKIQTRKQNKTKEKRLKSKPMQPNTHTCSYQG